ncbi:pyridoxamine phosphate oxidase [Sporothrix brasiliensis 5110]|uniref:Pyridoxamine phosphate oxidase n=1 Tax=Sporothrix brasiliensis 5110 TaxID=1398154 RepID=A0A0C2FKI9_9PEZI|nr:pyridoxamine phosphate oxidase [Sporothrix brasiliensis 5110]KIH91598.1 pyridoxamine phosphate oxidase [Sporothrix brasiliensis 5110]
MEQIPLNHEASDGDTNKQTTASLPTEVVQCLENARFLHLATCVDNQPHVSLMNYTYLPSAAGAPDHPIASPVIVMTSNPASKKTHNIVANPNVSLLVHDWVSHRPLHRRMSAGSALSDDGPGGGTESGGATSGALSGGLGALGGGAAAAEQPPSSLATLLLNLNTAAVSSISATINGTARLLAQGSPEEAYYREQHLAYNNFAADPVGPDETRIHQQIAHGRGSAAAPATAASGADPRPQDGRERFVAGEEVRVIVVAIRDVRISDWKGQVRDWVLAPPAPAAEASQPTINGM